MRFRPIGIVDSSTQYTLKVVFCLVHLVPCVSAVVSLGYFVLGIVCKRGRVLYVDNVAHYHVILTSTNALLYTIYVYEGHCGIAGVPPRASQ